MTRRAAERWTAFTLAKHWLLDTMSGTVEEVAKTLDKQVVLLAINEPLSTQRAMHDRAFQRLFQRHIRHFIRAWNASGREPHIDTCVLECRYNDQTGMIEVVSVMDLSVRKEADDA